MTGSDVAIALRGIGKRYRLGELPSAMLAERLGQAMRRSRAPRAAASDEFWALRDIDLDVHRGDVLGLVGRNGSGKSTLLKVISRITPPTEGEAQVRGRVGTLLEVGTGFHPELSGRENIFLNGAILGMKRREIAADYDAIVDFAGVERFLDTPVKRYSSGMYVRLAFAVAAHLDPEILLVDEVLAVGDAEFQQKCLGKMRDVANQGRTVVFVSHNVSAVRRLCKSAVLLEGGRLVTQGTPAEVISEYMGRAMPEQSSGRSQVSPDAPRLGTGEAKLIEVGLTGDGGDPLEALYLEQPFRVSAVFDVREEVGDAVVEFGISGFGGDRIATVQSTDREGPLLRFSPGRQEISADVDLTMLPGEFTIDVGIHRSNGTTVDYVTDCLRFTALNAAEEGNDHYPWAGVRGFMRPHSRWNAVRPADSLPLSPS